MLEFIFFDSGLRDRFVAARQAQGLVAVARDDHFALVVSLDETDLSDVLILEIESEYEALQDEQMQLTEQAEGGLGKHVVGFEVALPAGGSTMVSIPPALAARLVAHFDFDEIHDLFNRVAAAALNPDDRPICQRESD